MFNLKPILNLSTRLNTTRSIQKFHLNKCIYKSKEEKQIENDQKPIENEDLETARKSGQQYTEYSAKSNLIPDYYNPLISDLDELHIENKIAKELKIEYLSQSHDKTKSEIRGAICSDGKNLPFINLICQSKDQQPINVIFLLATGSPSTYMTDKALSFIFGTENAEKFTDAIKVDDYVMSVKRSNFSESTFKNLNILGLDFLKNSHFNLIKLEKREFLMQKSQKKTN